MHHEFAPWRAEYFNNKKEADGSCVFCEIAKNSQSDDENFIIFRAKHCFGVMNRYPYTLGEFMVIPYFHIDNIENLNQEIWDEMSRLILIGVGILKKKIGASGVNIGMNLGVAAGAGISEHIHYHAVPRWTGDTNFMTTIGYTRVHGIPFLEQFKVLKSAFKEVFSENSILT